jgi:transposase
VVSITPARDFEQVQPAPDLPIERGRPGPGLLAHVLVSKYLDGLPLYCAFRRNQPVIPLETSH